MEVIYQKREKLRNENRAFKYLIDAGEFTKLEISQYLNISIPTVSKILDGFLKKGLIIEVGTIDGKLGRRASKYKFNPDAYYAVGIKVEKDYISLILINVIGEIIKKATVYEEVINEENFTFLIINELKKFLWEFDKKELLKGIGIVVPGIVDPSTPTIKIGGNSILINESIKEIEEEFKLPIFIENEANAGAVGEYLMGNFEVVKNIFFVSVDESVGSGIIIGGHLYRGGMGNKAGEFGHIPIISDGKECICGSRGCLEQYCSNSALIEEFEKAFNCKINNYNDIFQDRFINNPIGKDILKTYSKNLATGLKSALLLLSPDKLIIGGKISEYKEYFEEELKKELFNEGILSSDSEVLEFSRFSNLSTLLGGAFFAFRVLYVAQGEK